MSCPYPGVILHSHFPISPLTRFNFLLFLTSQDKQASLSGNPGAGAVQVSQE